MPKKKKKKKFSDDLWALAKTKYHLSAHQIEMAKKLGLNPKKFGSLVPNKSEPWKKPLGQFIESCYYKRFWPTRRIYNRYVKQHVCCPTILLRVEEGMQSNAAIVYCM